VGEGRYEWLRVAVGDKRLVAAGADGARPDTFRIVTTDVTTTSSRYERLFMGTGALSGLGIGDWDRIIRVRIPMKVGPPKDFLVIGGGCYDNPWGEKWLDEFKKRLP
jgi:hypothetical protein